ncbi:MAG: hypothetical protein DHS80DRAFT_25644 [Piptocephalis tieghemiana]|nr:MAG: hypothetical protein DHS80DRAFT_25644 [Piptocephalis tieghemiana]
MPKVSRPPTRSSARLRAKTTTSPAITTTTVTENKPSSSKPYSPPRESASASKKSSSKSAKAPSIPIISEHVESPIVPLSTEKLLFTIEHCTSCKVYAKHAAAAQASLLLAFPSATFSVNPSKPRSKSFEVSMTRGIEGATPQDLWSGRTRGPPRKLKFPLGSSLVNWANDAIKAHDSK